MNLCDSYVKEVLGPPILKYNKWWLPVSYFCWSINPEETELMFDTKEEALSIKPNHHFLS